MPTLGPSSSKEQSPSRFRGTKFKDPSSTTDTIEGKPLPSNLDAEQGLLAACILDTTGEIMGRCAEQALTADHFYHFNHQVILRVSTRTESREQSNGRDITCRKA